MITNDYGVAERQKELLQLMKDVDQIMKENNICYSLCGGTLLGAVRHDGFIPWDDDLDIMVDRVNFEKMANLFRGHNNLVAPEGSSEKYKWMRHLWVYRIQKNGSQGTGLDVPTVDIMVMDNCPDNVVLRKIKVGIIKALQGMMHEEIDLSDKSGLMKICLLTTYGIGRLFPDAFKYNLYNRVSRIGNNKRTQYITGYNDLFKTLNCHYSGKLMDRIIKHTFEDTKFPITAEYDNYLTTQYGDYMTPPQAEDRIPSHLGG